MGQTQQRSEAAPVNGHSEASSSGEDWREKFESLQQEHETIVASLTKQKVSQAERESEVCRYREEVEILKSKNNDLRSKNRKAIEALNDREQKYAKLLREKN